MADVFISYKSEDRATTAKIAELLRRDALSVWWADEQLQGERVDDVVPEQIAAAKAVVVLISRRAIGSDWVAGEIVRAGEKIVPVRIDDISHRELPTPLLNRDIIDLAAWNGRADGSEFPKLRSRCIALKTGCAPIIVHSSPPKGSPRQEDLPPERPAAPPPAGQSGSTVNIGNIRDSNIGPIGTTHNYYAPGAARRRRPRDDEK